MIALFFKSKSTSEMDHEGSDLPKTDSFMEAKVVSFHSVRSMAV